MLLLFIVSMTSCVSSRKTLYVAAKKVSCQGVVPRKCLQVKTDMHQDDWHYFYNQIEGFSYEEGYRYKLRVKVTKLKNPPADASQLHYQLLKVIDKTKPEK